MKIAVIGNYPPRKCGIATFTENFVDSLLQVKDAKTSLYNQIDVFAMNDQDEMYEYPSIVKQSIRQNNKDDYYKAVDIINNSNYDCCYIQHEFGIYGGHSGLFVNIFFTQIKIPLFVTLHSVLKVLNFHQQGILENMILFSTQLIVMCKTALNILISYHNIRKEKISVIHHGAPVFKTFDRINAKKAKGWSNYTILMTFGLIGRSKGLETAIRSLPEVCKIYPNIRYVILGRTHPHIIKHEGEDYRECLTQLAEELGVIENVIFLDKYVNEPELTSYLQACDIYVTPYLNEAQITSGTLIYAVSSGAAVISTPYWHAVELFKKGRGILIDFESHKQLEKAILNLLSHPQQLLSVQQAAFEYGKNVSWPIIGKETHKLVLNSISKVTKQKIKTEDVFLNTQPEFSLDHFNSITDSTGIFQHAIYNLPDYNHGYCTDDNARALIMAIKLNRNIKSRESEKLITKFLSFLNYMQVEDGSFVNMLSYSKNHLLNNYSQDSFGRAIWALGYTIKYAPLLNQKAFAYEMFRKAVHYFNNLIDLKSIANVILGIVFYLKENPDDKSVEFQLKDFLQKLYISYKTVSDKNWRWYENKLSYDNAILPLAMFYGASYFKKQEYFDVAMESLTFLEKVSYKDNHLSLIGNEKWLEKGHKKSSFSQQPIDAMAFVLLYQCLYKLTNDKKYKNKSKSAFSWFLGNNDLGASIYDQQTKGCADGLFEDNLNLNQGGESLLAWLIAHLTFLSVEEKC
ncbi:MAG: glycosyltransferase family 4 protein [Bacteroidales bacterium]|jgi:glycosyltransferase involved in cell wall biosynthesis|nr:glycosyltransferase family 4 protein [Bacteroidales bacterium]